MGARSVRYNDAAFQGRTVVKIDHVVIVEPDAVRSGCGRRSVDSIILVQVDDAGGGIVRFLPHDVEKPGQCDAFGAHANSVAQRGRIRPDHVQKGLSFIDDDRPDRLVRPVVHQLPQIDIT